MPQQFKIAPFASQIIILIKVNAVPCDFHITCHQLPTAASQLFYTALYIYYFYCHKICIHRRCANIYVMNGRNWWHYTVYWPVQCRRQANWGERNLAIKRRFGLCQLGYDEWKPGWFSPYDIEWIKLFAIFLGSLWKFSFEWFWGRKPVLRARMHSDSMTVHPIYEYIQECLIVIINHSCWIQ